MDREASEAPLQANQTDEKEMHHIGSTALLRRFGVQSKRHPSHVPGRGIATSQRREQAPSLDGTTLARQPGQS